MSSNNDNSGATMGLALALAVLGFIGIFIYALAVFFALALTLLSAIAWNRPVKLGKTMLCTPMEARIFVASGVAGGASVCAFALLCTMLFDTRIEDGWGFYLMTGGYAFASLAVLMTMAEQYPGGHPDDPAYHGTVIEHDPAPVPQLASETIPTPFEYASWNDEVEEPPFAKPECQGCWLNAAPRNPDTPVLNR